MKHILNKVIKIIMKAFWYDEKRKNICGLHIRQLRKVQKITQKKLTIMAQLAGYDSITESAINTTPEYLLQYNEEE